MPTDLPLTFHWSPSLVDSAPDPETFTAACRAAEAAGFESVHVPARICFSEALRLATAAGNEALDIKFRIGWDFAGALASLRGAELKNAWEVLQGRVIVHMSFGSEEPARNGNYLSAGGFIASLRALFPDSAPAFEVEGDSAEAAFLAIKHGDCLWRRPHRANQVYADALPVLHFGKDVGLVSRVVARETRQEALDAVAGITEPEWIAPYLCVAAGTATLVGSYEGVADAVREFNRNGISRLLLREAPGQPEEMARFAANVMPLIHRLKSGALPE
jgi:hypothetical protein